MKKVSYNKQKQKVIRYGKYKNVSDKAFMHTN